MRSNLKIFNLLKKNYFPLVLILLLTFSRLIPHPPNFTPIIAFAIFGPALLKDRMLGALLPIISMFISDFIIGFHVYQFVVYASLICISFFIVLIYTITIVSIRYRFPIEPFMIILGSFSIKKIFPPNLC
mgnify:CR=1 FL=1